MIPILLTAMHSHRRCSCNSTPRGENLSEPSSPEHTMCSARDPKACSRTPRSEGTATQQRGPQRDGTSTHRMGSHLSQLHATACSIATSPPARTHASGASLQANEPCAAAPALTGAAPTANPSAPAPPGARSTARAVTATHPTARDRIAPQRTVHPLNATAVIMRTSAEQR